MTRRGSMLSKQDQELIAAATEAIKRRYRNDWQEVGAAFRTRDGRIYTGVNLDAYLGRMAVCAEAVALGRAITEKRRDRDRHDRGGAPSRADRAGSGRRRGVAVRELPRIDLGLRPQRPRHRAQRQRSGHRHASASCCPTSTAGSGPCEDRSLSTTPRRLVTAERRDEDIAETSLRPQRLAEFIGQQQARANLSVFIEAARTRREALDHVLFVGPPGPRQDHAGADRVARARRQFPRHLRAGDRQGRRSRGAAHQSRRARRAVHRRDPPAQSGGRGNPLSGDGGFPARSDHRRGAGGALGEDRSRASSRWSARPRAPGCSPSRCATASASRCGSTSIPRRSSRRSSIAARACSASA